MCGRSTNADDTVSLQKGNVLSTVPVRERGGVSQHQIYPLKYLTEKSFPPVFKILLFVLYQFEGNIR